MLAAGALSPAARTDIGHFHAPRDAKFSNRLLGRAYEDTSLGAATRRKKQQQEAKKRIKEECKYAEKNQTIQFCHGFNSGTQIRDFIRNGQLQQSLDSLNIEGNIWAKDLGNTYFNRT